MYELDCEEEHSPRERTTASAPGCYSDTGERQRFFADEVFRMIDRADDHSEPEHMGQSGRVTDKPETGRERLTEANVKSGSEKHVRVVGPMDRDRTPHLQGGRCSGAQDNTIERRP